MRVMFAVFSQPGHLYPFLGIAQHLEKTGHEVVFFCPEDVTPALKRAALRARCVSPETAPLPKSAIRSADFTERLKNPKWAEHCYAHLLLRPVPAYVEGLRAAVRECSPDVLATDPIFYAGPIVATQENIPWACISATFMPVSPRGFRSNYHDAMENLASDRVSLFEAQGVKADFKFGETISPWLNTVFTTEAFTPRAEADNGYSEFVGPPTRSNSRGDEPEFQWERLSADRPLVYVSFGTQLAPARGFFETFARAFADDRIQVVMSLGDWADDPEPLALPQHFITVRYAPQIRLLERAAAVVTHGGASSVSEALSHGKPMLVIPLGHEQSLQAHLVQASGTGLAANVSEDDPRAWRNWILSILKEKKYENRAKEIQASFEKTDSADRILRALVQLSESKRP